MSRSFTRIVRNWTTTFRAPLSRPSASRRRIVPLRFQDLEDRTTPTTYTVTNALDDGSVGSFRWAVSQAIANGSSDVINFDTSGVFATPQTIDLLTALPSFTGGDLTITGTGASNLTIERSPAAATNFGIFTVSSAAPNVTIDGVTIKGGTAGAGSGINVTGTSNLTVRNSVVTGNTGGTGAIYLPPSFGGLLTVQYTTITGNTNATGGIYFFTGGSLLVQHSTISNNTGTGTASFEGGGIIFYGAVGSSGFTIENSTITGNTSAATTAGGGAINFNYASGAATIRDCTITGNTAVATASGGGGIGFTGGSMAITIDNSVIAQNNGPADGPDVRGTAGNATARNSLLGVIPPSNFTDGGGNQTGTQASPLDPQLGPLQDNGGLTFTRAPQTGSPVIDTGSNSLLPPGMPWDQRGFGYVRKYNGTVDIGSVENQPLGNPVALATTTNVDASEIGQMSYSFTVLYADPTGTNQGIKVVDDVINKNDVVRVTGPNGFDQLATYESIDNATDGTPRTATYSIKPPGGSWSNLASGIYTVSLEANKVFDFDGNAIAAGPLGTFMVGISPIVVYNADDSGPGSLRDAITVANTFAADDEIQFDPTFFNSPRTITLASPLPQITTAGGALKIEGPGIANLKVDGAGQFRVFNSASPSLTLSNFEVTGGMAAGGLGGGLLTSGSTIIDHMLFDANTATAAGFSFDQGGGGAIATPRGASAALLIKFSTISGNTASNNGGGIFLDYGSSILDLENSTISGNSTTYTGTPAGYIGGGGIGISGTPTATPPTGFIPGTLVVRNSTIANNTTTGSGGGIGGNGFYGTLLIQSATITGNSAAATGASTNYPVTFGGGGIQTADFGFGPKPPVLTIENSVVSGNTNASGEPDIDWRDTVNVNYSAVGDPTGFTLTGGNNVPFGTDLMLGPLQANGGPTQTVAPQTGSPLIDAGSDNLIPHGVGSDQRGPGFFRSFGNAVDIGSVEVQPITTGPFATVDAADLFSGGGTDYTFTVTYSDPNGTNNGIDVSSVIGNNNAIKVLGPNGFSQLAKFVSIDVGTNGTPRTATYKITAPGGTWDGPDIGYYKIQMQANQVKDLDGNFAPQVNLGTFLVVISPIMVTNANDAGPGSLRDAMTWANLDPNDDEIRFDPTVFGTHQDINLASPLPQIAALGGGLTITGPGVEDLTLNGGGQFRVLDSLAPTLTLSGFTITGGLADDTAGKPNGEFGGGLRAGGIVTLDHMVLTGNSATGHANFFDAGAGGAVGMLANSFLTVHDTTIANNTADQKGGGIFFRFGGGLVIEDSTISGNSSSPTGTNYGLYGGGGIFFLGTPSSAPPPGFTASALVIENSTIANNTTTGCGGAFNLGEFSGGLVLLNSTISGNSAAANGTSTAFGLTYGGGGLFNGVFSNGPFILLNSIVSGNTNTTSPDMQTKYNVYAYYSAIGSINGFTYTVSSHNLATGTPLMLTPLQDNGGPTQTMAPQLGSPVLDVGSNNFVVPGETDQRGGGRIFNTTVDIGAVELAPPEPVINQAASQADPTKTGPILFDVQFNTLVSGFTAGSIDLSGSSLTGLTPTLTQVGPAEYLVSVTGMNGEGTVVASIPAGAVTDPQTGLSSLASTSTDNSVTFDNIPPAVTIDKAAGQADPTNTAPVNFAVTFSEPITGFDPSDIDFTGSTISGLTATITPTADPTVYTVGVTPPPGQVTGKIVINIPAGAVTDLAGNPSTAPTIVDNSVTFDNVPPTVTINQHGTDDPVGGTSVQFDVLFSEPVLGFDATKVDLLTAPPGATVSVSGTGPAYTVTVSGMTQGGVIQAQINAGVVTDLAGNLNLQSTSTDNQITYIHSGTLQFDAATYSISEHNSPLLTVKVSRTVEAGTTAEGSLTVDYATVAGTATEGVRYDGVNGSFTWGPGETGVKTFTVQIHDDQIVDGDQTFGLALSNTLAGALGTPSSATVTITDYEEGTLSFGAPIYNVAESDNGHPFGGLPTTATITVTRTNGSNGAVSVDFSSASGTAHAGSDYTAPPNQTLTWADGDTQPKTITIPIIDDTRNEGYESFTVNLTNPSTVPPLGPGQTFNPLLGISTATVTIAPSDGFVIKALPKLSSRTFSDADGDQVTVSLGGGTAKGAQPPTATVYITDPSDSGKGPIELITLNNTDPTRTTLTIKVKKPKGVVGNDGRVGLGTIEKDPSAVAAVGLKSISAPTADLNGGGITLDGYVGNITLGNVQNGADIITTGGNALQKQKTSIKLLAVSDGTDITVANPIATLAATGFGNGSITAPYVGTIHTKGRAANVKKGITADPGNFDANVTLSGTGVQIGKSALAQLKVKGNIIGSDMNVDGKVGSVSASKFVDSRLFVGFNGTDTGIGTYSPTGLLNSFSTSAATNSFQNSHVIANTIKSAALGSVNATNGGVKIGFIAHTTIGQVTSKAEKFKYTPKMGNSGNIAPDFEIRAGVAGHVRLTAQSAIAIHEVAPSQPSVALTPKPVVVAGTPTPQQSIATSTATAVSPPKTVVAPPAIPPVQPTSSVAGPGTRWLPHNGVIDLGNLRLPPPLTAGFRAATGFGQLTGSHPSALNAPPTAAIATITAHGPKGSASQPTGPTGGIGAPQTVTAANVIEPALPVSSVVLDPVVVSTVDSQVVPVPVAASTQQLPATSNPAPTKVTPPTPLLSALPVSLTGGPLGRNGVEVSGKTRSVTAGSGNLKNYPLTTNFLGQQVNARGALPTVSTLLSQLSGGTSSSLDVLGLV
jgi:hypothetical protein